MNTKSSEQHEDDWRRQIIAFLKDRKNSFEANAEAIAALKDYSGILLSYQDLHDFLAGSSLNEIATGKKGHLSCEDPRARHSPPQELSGHLPEVEDLPPMLDNLYYRIRDKEYGPMGYRQIVSRFKTGAIPIGTRIVRRGVLSKAGPILIENYAKHFRRFYIQYIIRNSAISAVVLLLVGAFLYNASNRDGGDAFSSDHERHLLQLEYERLQNENARIYQEIEAAKARGETYPDSSLALKIERNIKDMHELVDKKRDFDDRSK